MSSTTVGQAVINVRPLDFSNQRAVLGGLKQIAGVALQSGEQLSGAPDYTGATGYYGKRGANSSEVRDVGEKLTDFIASAYSWQKGDKHKFENIAFDINKLRDDAQSGPTTNQQILKGLTDAATDLISKIASPTNFTAACALVWFGNPNSDLPNAIKDNTFLPEPREESYTIYSIAYTTTRVLASIMGRDAVSAFLNNSWRSIKKELKKDKKDEEDDGDTTSDSGGGRSEDRDGGAPPTAPSSPGPSETLSDFLEKHKDKAGGSNDVREFAQAIIGRSSNAGDGPRYKDYSDAIAKPLRPVASAGAAAWEGATIDGRTFDQGEGGLREYLAFAWAATRSQGDDGAAVATSMGIDPRKEDNFPRNPDWILLGKMGAIAPFAFMAIYKPADVDKIPEVASIKVGGLTSQITGPYNVGFYLNIGPEGIGQFAGFSGAAAKDFLAMQGSGTKEWTLTIGDKSWTASKDVSFGGRISSPEWDPADTAAAAAGPPTPEELSGAISTRSAQVTKEGTTTGGSRTLDLQNMLIKPDSSGLANVISTTLEKRIVMTGDRWTLRVNSPSNYAILIPIKMKRAMNESTHWAGSFVGASDAGGAQPDVAYFPTSMIEWVYEKNFHKYGPTSPRIARIDYEPSDIDIDALNSDFKGQNIKVISIDEAKRSGTASGEFDTIESAIANYISLSGPKNPVGVPLYLTSNLHGQMNSYPRRVYKVG